MNTSAAKSDRAERGKVVAQTMSGVARTSFEFNPCTRRINSPRTSFNCMTIRLGKPVFRPNPKDLVDYSIWVHLFDEDQSGYCAPVLTRTNNATRSLQSRYLIMIAARVRGTDLLAVALLSKLPSLAEIRIAHGTTWAKPVDIEGVRIPMILDAVPKIYGESDVSFELAVLATAHATRTR